MSAVYLVIGAVTFVVIAFLLSYVEERIENINRTHTKSENVQTNKYK